MFHNALDKSAVQGEQESFGSILFELDNDVSAHGRILRDPPAVYRHSRQGIVLDLDKLRVRENMRPDLDVAAPKKVQVMRRLGYFDRILSSGSDGESDKGWCIEPFLSSY